MAIFVFTIIGLGAGAIHLLLQSEPAAGVVVGATLLRYVLLLGVALPLISTGVLHLVRSDAAAKLLGWPPASPFQKVAGIWNFAGAGVAIAAFVSMREYQTAAVLVNVVFWGSSAILHGWHAVGRRYTASLNWPAAAGNLTLAGTLVALHVVAR